jgi:hypothetical protein
MMTLTKLFLKTEYKTIDLKALTLKIVQIVECILLVAPESIEEKMIIENGMNVWVTCIN